MSSAAPVGSMPSFTTLAWLKWYQGLLSMRGRECPVARTTTYYVVQHASGDASGGGQAGTQSAPYRVRHLDDLSSLIATLDNSPDVAILLARSTTATAHGGSYYYRIAAAGTGGLTLGGSADMTLGAWGTGNKPIISGFIADDGTPWTLDTDRYWKSYTSAVYWVRMNTAPASSLTTGTETVFTKRTSAATVGAADNSWWWDSVAQRLYVRVGANEDPAGDIEVCQSAADDGIAVVDVDGCRIDNLVSMGWAMDNRANNVNCCTVAVTGTNACVVSDCEFYYGPKHAHQSYANSAGGITTWLRCKSGLCLAPTADPPPNQTDPTNHVAYNLNGSHELIRVDCENYYGALPESAVTTSRRGTPYYAHTGGVATMALAIVWGEKSYSTTYGCKGCGGLADLPAPTTHATIAEYRGFIVGEQFGVDAIGSETECNPAVKYFIRAWDRIRWKRPSGTAGTVPVFNLAAAANAMYGIHIGSAYECDFSVCAVAHGSWVHGANLAWPCMWLHCQIKSVVAAGGQDISFEYWDSDTANTRKMRWWNSILSIDASANTDAQIHTVNHAGGPGLEISDTPTPGMSHCAFWHGGTGGGATMYRPNFGAPGDTTPWAGVNGAYWGYDQCVNYIDDETTPALSAEPAFATVPASTSPLYQAATTQLPFTLEWWHDATTGKEYPWPDEPHIGSVQTIELWTVPSYGGASAAYSYMVTRRSWLNKRKKAKLTNG